MNLVVLSLGPELPACEGREFHVDTTDGRRIPVAASMINKSVVMREKKRIAVARTDLVGQRLIEGAMRIAPTH